MKKAIIFFSLLLLLTNCKKEVVEKPKKLIEEDKMVNIIYDLTLLEAIKAQNSPVENKQRTNPKNYIYKKYNIDSLQFAQSNRYYASAIANYKKMYEKVNQRIVAEQKLADSMAKKDIGKKALPSTAVNSGAPQVQ